MIIRLGDASELRTYAPLQVLLIALTFITGILDATTYLGFGNVFAANMDWTLTAYPGPESASLLVQFMQLDGSFSEFPLDLRNPPIHRTDSGVERINCVPEGGYFLRVIGIQADWSLALTRTGNPQLKPEVAGVASIQAPRPDQSSAPSPAEVLSELESMVGLDSVKRNVAGLVNLLKVRRLRVEQGLPTTPITLHSVFLGNPGTGKTPLHVSWHMRASR